jgi:hypothetical protein
MIIYRVTFRLGTFSKIAKDWSATGDHKKPCEILVNGVRIHNGSGKSVWGAVGHARLALRNILGYAIPYSYAAGIAIDRDEEVETILKNYVSLDGSKPIHIRVLDDNEK